MDGDFAPTLVPLSRLGGGTWVPDRHGCGTLRGLVVWGALLFAGSQLAPAAAARCSEPRRCQNPHLPSPPHLPRLWLSDQGSLLDSVGRFSWPFRRWCEGQHCGWCAAPKGPSRLRVPCAVRPTCAPAWGPLHLNALDGYCSSSALDGALQLGTLGCAGLAGSCWCCAATWLLKSPV